MDELNPGTLIAGRYSVVRSLGRGASKQVYLADDRLAGIQVALAMLLAERTIDATMSARFSREARAASVLRSLYTVRVFDVGKLSDGTRYLVTEAVLGRGLDAALTKGPLPTETAAMLAMQILSALAEAHTRGILHRDIKPENVLLAPSPRGEIAKLTDFGLAKVLDVDLEGSILLKTGQNTILGTPAYMSPEQWQGLPLDPSTDVYSVGVILFEMLTGAVPFTGRAVHEFCVGHLTQDVPPFPPTVTVSARALEAVTRRALAKQPADRFRSALAMREAIEAVTGLRLDATAEQQAPLAIGRYARAELVSEAWPGVIQLVATPNVVLGREADAHVVIRCLPHTEDNARRTQAVSRYHAQLEWRGGRAHVADLGSRGGTRVRGRAVGVEPHPLQDGDEIAIGRHVTLRFEHAPAPLGELPRWARLVRTDAYGGGQVHVLVLTEAKISSADDAAIRVPASGAAGDVLRLRVHDGALAVLPVGSAYPVPLYTGQSLRLGGIVISIAVA